MTMRLAVVVCGLVSLASPGLILAMGSPAPQSQGQAAQKNWKDRDEYDLYTNITNPATAPQKKLDLLTQWTAKYPNTDFKTERATLYVTTYAALNRPNDVVASAKQLLAIDPKDFTGLYYVTLLTLRVADTSPGALDDSEKAANGLLAALDTAKPPSMSAEQWATARQETEAVIHSVLGWVAMQKKDNAKAEVEFTKSLQSSPSSAQISYWLGTVLIGEIIANKDPSKYPLALYEIARSLSVEGPAALNPGGRQSVRDYLEKRYIDYHGSKDGIDDLIAATKASALPPPDFKLKSVTDIENEKAAARKALIDKDPSLGMWLDIRTALTGDGGDNYFTNSMKGAQTPAFTGRLISAEPETKPKKLVLAIADKDSPNPKADCTVVLDSPLPSKAEGDTIITFQGIPDSYTKDPFMVTFNAEKASIKGWTGKEAPVHHPPVRRHTATH